MHMTSTLVYKDFTNYIGICWVPLYWETKCVYVPTSRKLRLHDCIADRSLDHTWSKQTGAW